MPLQTIRHIPSRFLASYLQQLEKQRQLLERIRHILPSQLDSHLTCCVFDEKKLTLYTDSAAWASQIRFYQQEILASIIGEWQGKMPTFLIKVRPNVNEYKGLKTPKAKAPSLEKLEIVRRQCDHFTDEELKKSMQKLCSTLSRRRADHAET